MFSYWSDIYRLYYFIAYLSIFLLGSSLEGLYKKITIDKYQATIVALDSYEQKRRSGKLPVTIQKVTVKFKPKESSDFIITDFNTESDTPFQIGQTYEIRYNTKKSKAIFNSDTDINIILILLGLIPLYFVIYGICYAFELKLCKRFPEFGKLIDKY